MADDDENWHIYRQWYRGWQITYDAGRIATAAWAGKRLISAKQGSKRFTAATWEQLKRKINAYAGR